MRLPKTLLDAVKASAARAGVPYQRFIRQVLEAAVRSSAGRGKGGLNSLPGDVA
jgi:hypothetical protein